jgi:hypothetical protein
MSQKKPEFKDYIKYLEETKVAILPKNYETYFNTVTTKMGSDFENSELWIKMLENLREYNDEYYITTNYQLFREYTPAIVIKPYQSFLLKTYRKNILENKNWPEEPSGGWYRPENWLSRINDTIRTLFEVKYLDGVEFLISKIETFCKERKDRFEYHLEARDEGYYAGHVYITQQFEIPKITWDTEIITTKVEIQITTQLQEVIRLLLHNYYEENRKSSDKNENWQWNFKSNEFSANYLGHILHYLEGMIVEVRDESRHVKEKPQ